MASETATAQDLERELEQEHRLVEEAQQGNLDAMRPILERYAAPLYGTVILPRLVHYKRIPICGLALGPPNVNVKTSTAPKRISFRADIMLLNKSGD